MTEVNIPLLRKTVEWAEAEAAKPDQRFSEWYQGRWILPKAELESYERDISCGSAFCIAGQIAYNSMTRGEYMDFAGNVRDKATDRIIDTADERAEQLLGAPATVLVDGDELDLFDGGNTIEDVRRIAEAIAGERL